LRSVWRLSDIWTNPDRRVGEDLIQSVEEGSDPITPQPSSIVVFINWRGKSLSMPNRLFVMGMFRSGTTLFARMLHAHDDIACASDPFRPFFNCLRDDVSREVGASIDDFDPLGDYFADAESLELFEAVQQATLNRQFPDDVRDELHDRILSHAEPFSPKITERLDSIRGETFLDVYDSLWSYVPEAYGRGDEEWEATKEVWTTEFTPVLASAYPNSKFLQVVRDPRAVCASKNVNDDVKYPWLFLTRQWRKLAILSHLYGEWFEDRVHVVRYEDLVQSPHETVDGICDFLDVALDEDLLDPSNFVDGAGEQWLQNTSYQGSSASFNTDSVDKWRDVLTDREAEYVEQLTYPGMSVYGYDQDTSGFGLSDDIALDPPMVPKNELADWITEHYGDWDSIDHVNEVGIEQTRQRFLTTDEDVFESIDDQLLKAYFLDPEYAETARKFVDR